MFTLFCSGRGPGDPNPYCCILRSPSDCFLHCSVFIAVHSTQFKPAPLLPGRRLGGSRRLSSRSRLSSSSAAGCLTILVVFTLRHCRVMIDRRSALDSNSIADCRFTLLVKKGRRGGRRRRRGGSGRGRPPPPRGSGAARRATCSRSRCCRRSRRRRRRRRRNEDLEAHRRMLARSPADQNYVKHQ